MLVTGVAYAPRLITSAFVQGSVHMVIRNKTHVISNFTQAFNGSQPLSGVIQYPYKADGPDGQLAAYFAFKNTPCNIPHRGCLVPAPEMLDRVLPDQEFVIPRPDINRTLLPLPTPEVLPVMAEGYELHVVEAELVADPKGDQPPLLLISFHQHSLSYVQRWGAYYILRGVVLCGIALLIVSPNVHKLFSSETARGAR